jgi:polysaccharide pyruvyl transferase CsaB
MDAGLDSCRVGSRMRYLLGGYYGMRNVGDDVLLYVTLAEVMRLDPDARFTVISEHAERTPPGARVTTTPGGRRLENVRQMLGHDVWLFGGGGLLQDGSLRSRAYLTRLAHTARVVKWLRRKVVMLGIGVGPLTTAPGRAAAAALLRLADLVTVRDEESRARAAELAPTAQVHLAGDLAFLLPQHLVPPCSRQHSGAAAVRKTLGVSLLPYAGSRDLDPASDAQAVASLAKALNRVLARQSDWDVTLFEFFSGSREYGDDRVLQALYRQLAARDRVTYRPYAGDFPEVWGDLAACTAFVGMRFHSCVLAHLAGVPCLMIAYHPKSESLSARLGLSADAVVPLAAVHDAAGLAARIDAVMTEGTKFQPRVPIEAIAAESARTFMLFEAWLAQHGGRREAPCSRRYQ